MEQWLAGKHFDSKEQLFQAINNEWMTIPDEKLHNYYSSFLARCYICRQNNGDSLNGKWKEIKKKHDEYRTKLHYIRDEKTGKIFISEQ